MDYYFAPMQGVTGYICRNAHRRVFGGVEKYFMPFLSPVREHVLTPRELRDLTPEHNADTPAVPQILTRTAADFIWAADRLRDMGYRELNLNLGCPSGTVVAKGKGSGFLGDPVELDRFLEEIYAVVGGPLSIKTRLGLRDPEEFPRLLEVFGRYPVAELTIHPRIQKDFYKGPVRMEWFDRALAQSALPLCYNGDLTRAADCRAFSAAYPAVGAAMLGRGLAGNPALARQAGGGPPAARAELEAYHAEIYGTYRAVFSDSVHVLPQMKELWFYLIRLFRDSGRHAKAIRKAETAAAYQVAVAAVFRDLDLLEDTVAGW